MSILNKIIKKEEDKDKKSSGVASKKAGAAKVKPAKKAPVAKRAKSGETPVHYFEIIKKPHISEKAFAGNELGQYVFLVSENSNKTEIKKAIEKAYKVAVKGVNITKAKDKPKRYRGFSNTKSGFKKAIVTLHKGNTIDVMESAK